MLSQTVFKLLKIQDNFPPKSSSSLEDLLALAFELTLFLLSVFTVLAVFFAAALVFGFSLVSTFLVVAI